MKFLKSISVFLERTLNLITMKLLLLPLIFVCTLILKSQDGLAQCVTCDSISEALKKPEIVESINLSNQGITEIPDISVFPNLRTLDLSYNHIVSVDKALKGNPSLKVLKINRNYGLDIVGFTDFCNKSENLEILQIFGCGIIAIPFTISNNEKLLKLDLSNNKLKSLPSALEELENLEDLNLANNELVQIIYLGSSFWNLKKIDISGNENLDLEPILLGLSFLNNLEELTLSQDFASTTFPKEIGELEVPKIVIKNTAIVKLNKAFGKNDALKELVFEDCLFNDEKQIVNQLKTLNNLDALSFFDTDCPANISELKQIDELKIFQNSKPPLDEIGKMKQLKTLDMSLQPLEENQKVQLKTDLPKTEIVFKTNNFEENMAKNQVEAKLILAPQEVILSAKDSTTLVFENSMFEVPKNGFLDQDGTLYQGNVRVQVTEYFDPISMALTGAPMVYGTGDEAELFGSNGMFEFRAKDENGKDLQPNPDAVIQVSIKNMQPENPGKIFLFDTINNQWRTTGVPEIAETDSLFKVFIDSINKVSDYRFIDNIDIPIIVKVKMKRKKYDPSLLNFTFEKQLLLKRGKGKLNYYQKLYLKNFAQRTITRYEWKIDSLVDDATKDFFKKLHKNQKKIDKRKKNYRYAYDNHPRYVKNLEVKPNFERDNFDLSFRFKDSLITIPVYISSGGSTKSIISEQEKFYKAYLKSKKEDEKLTQKIQKKRLKKLKEYAQSRRNELIGDYIRRNNLMQNNYVSPGRNNVLPVQIKVSPFRIIFRLLSFGLVNCDYMVRVKPQVFLAITSVRDENGNIIKVPDEVRVLFLNINTYLDTRNSVIPYFSNQKNVLFFSIDETKMAVVEIKKERNKLLVAKTLDIKGMSPVQVKQALLAL